MLDRHMLDSEFSLSEARVLFEIGSTERCTATMLIDRLRLDAGYLSRMLKRFAKLDLVHREQSGEDGRLYYLCLSENGKRTLADLNRRSDEQIRLMMEPLAEQARHRVTTHMTAIERILSGDDPQFPPEVRIRNELRPGDVGSLIHLHGWLYAEECGYNHAFEAYVCQTFVDFFRQYSPDKDRFWFAESEEGMIGAIAIAGLSESDAQLRWFILRPEYRGAGYGKRLFQEALRYCREKGFRRVVLATTDDQRTAIAMYTKAGFTKIGEHANEAWGVRHREETYELLL
nr:helix-turn-helix domain-containing GNAT family N-acetyltransferase [Paenibacillus artemisiicola]